MGVIFVVGLVFVVLDLDEVGVDSGGVERKGDEGVDGSGFGDRGEECPGPRVMKRASASYTSETRCASGVYAAGY